MKSKTRLFLLMCFFVIAVCAACIAAPEDEGPIKIDIEKDEYRFDDNRIRYILVSDINIAFSHVQLERKIGDAWETVPSTIPDPVAWCGTRGGMQLGETQGTIPFLSYNGTLAPGTYRIVLKYLSYASSGEDQWHAAGSKEFSLTGEFPMTEGHDPPANVYLSFETNTFSKSVPEIQYKIINESGGEVYISPDITLMLYQDSQWRSFIYATGADGEITRPAKETIRTINAQKLSGGFEACAKIRIIEQLAIPMRNVFYAFYEIDLE